MKRKLLYLLFFLNLILIIFFWFDNSFHQLTKSQAGFFISLGRLFGLLAAFFVLIQVTLIGRSIWIERIFGLDKLSKVHHLNGYLAIFFIISHPILIIVGYSSLSSKNYIDQFLDLLKYYPNVFQATIALVLFIITVSFSIYIIRKKLKYEFWYLIHLFNYLAIYLSFGHQFKNGEDLLASKTFYLYWLSLYTFVFLNHLIFRFLRPWFNFFKHGFYISKVVKENYNTTSIYIKGKNLADFKVKSGQFMIFRFLDKARWFEAHPFSLSNYSNSKYLRITPKMVGDFTSKLPKLKSNTKVVIDGPLGVFTLDEIKRKKILFIAGGVGITPIRSLIEGAIHKKLDFIFLFGNRRRKDILFKNEFENLQKKYFFKMIHILSNDEKWIGEKGYIDKEKITKLVKDIKERDVYLCGPPIMMDKIIKILHNLQIPKSQIHFEKFSL